MNVPALRMAIRLRLITTAFSVESARYSFSSLVSVVAVSSWMFVPTLMRPAGLSDFMS